MSDRKITVELTEVEARMLADGCYIDTAMRAVADKVRAAMPPAYPNGTRATMSWPGEPGMQARHVVMTAGFQDPLWISGYRLDIIRVLADDEIAVKRVAFAALPGRAVQEMRGVAATLRGVGNPLSAAVISAYADALEAEAKS